MGIHWVPNETPPSGPMGLHSWVNSKTPNV